MPVYTVALGTDERHDPGPRRLRRHPHDPRPAGPRDAQAGRRADRRQVLRTPPTPSALKSVYDEIGSQVGVEHKTARADRRSSPPPARAPAPRRCALDALVRPDAVTHDREGGEGHGGEGSRVQPAAAADRPRDDLRSSLDLGGNRTRRRWLVLVERARGEQRPGSPSTSSRTTATRRRPATARTTAMARAAAPAAVPTRAVRARATSNRRSGSGA